MLNILLFAWAAVAQQNLIYNGSFEEYSSCPTTNNTYNGEFEKATGWWSPSYFSTPDYFNACANGGVGSFDVGVPNNFWGYQYAYHGDGFVNLSVGFWTPEGSWVEGEFMQTRVIETLQPCNKYTICFYISLANFSSHNIQFIDVGFSEDSSFYCDEIETNCALSPIIDEFISIPVLTGIDTVEWSKVTMEFSVNQMTNFITIGCFDHNLNDTVYIQEPMPPWNSYNYTTYYIDSISIFKSGTIEDCSSNIFIPNIFTPNKDGINDYVDFKNFDQVEILNRWGATVLVMGKQSNFEWHGKNFREEDLPDGVYFYIAEKAGIQQTGSIYLIRSATSP